MPDQPRTVGGGPSGPQGPQGPGGGGGGGGGGGDSYGQEPGGDKTSNTGWIIGIVAVVVILLVGLVLWVVVSNDGEVTTTTTEPTTTTTTLPPDPPEVTVSIGNPSVTCVAGAASTFSWETSGADDVRVVDPNGKTIAGETSGTANSGPLKPCDQAPFTDQYTVIASNAGGTTEKAATIQYLAAPPTS